MNFNDKTTIIALSTPYQVSAIHVIRLSGSRSLEFLKSVCFFKEEVEARRVYFRRLKDPVNDCLIDEVVCFYFDAPRSYTGEEMVEIHTHGSVLIVDSILEMAKKSGIVLAMPGEFTERAFLNGKMNIDQAQAVDGLIRAKQSYLRDNALKILTKKEAFHFDAMREGFIQIKAQVEAMIEFPEDDVEGQMNNTYVSLKVSIDKMIESLKNLSNNYQSAKKREDGVHIVLLGEPNAGKSTLLNFLLGKKRSIVSSEAGTTRDYIKELYETSLGNFWLYDTAGIREARNEIEREGISLSLDLSKEADFLIVLFDERLDAKWLGHLDFPKERTLVYLNKTELLSKEKIESFRKAFENYGIFRSFSLKSSNDDLRNRVNEDFFNLVKKYYSLEESHLSLVNDRQFDLVGDILLKLEEIELYLKNQVEVAILVGELEDINFLLGDLSLKMVEGEEVFDQLFRSFCIGK